MKIPEISVTKIKKHDMAVTESQREVQIWLASQARENFAKKILGWGGNAEKMRVCFLFFLNFFIYF